jgi:hypothetical protein
MAEKVTLMIAGKPLTFMSETRIEGCVRGNVVSRGPCPKKGPLKPTGVVKSVAKKAAIGGRAIAKASSGRKRAEEEHEASLKAERQKIAKQLMIRMAAGEKFDVDPDDYPALVDGLNDPQLVEQAEKEVKASGKTPEPFLNLALGQIKGKGNEGLFAKPLRDIPRDQMPALPDNVKDLVPFMKALTLQGVDFEIVDLDPREIRSVQSQLIAPKVAKMSGYMKSGWKPGGLMIVSEENALGDGHHRWAGAATAALLHEQGVPGYSPVKVQALRVKLPIDQLLPVMEQHSGPKKSATEKP